MRVLSVNVSMPEVVRYKGRDISTAINKKPVSGVVHARKTNIDGDGQADLSVHGGHDKAAYAFPVEHYLFFETVVGQRGFPYGHFGENLTTEGMLEHEMHIGDQFGVGDAVFEVSQPRSPCFKFAVKLGTPDAVRSMLNSGKTGYYLRVIKEGAIEPGEITRLVFDTSAPSVEEVHRLMYFDLLDTNGLKRALGTRALAKTWQDAFAVRLKKLEKKIAD